jgi:F-type H+-transporting ATPase subunit b
MILSRLTVSAICTCGLILASEGSGNGDTSGWMEKWLSFDPGLFMWTIVTFLIVLMILKWKAWGPLINALDKREEDIREALASAEKARQDAEKASSEYEDMMRKSQADAQQIVSEGKAAGERVKNDIQSAANDKANEIIEKAKAQIDVEREKAIQEIKSSVVDLSMEAAARVIEKNLESEDNRKLVNQALEGIGQA